MLLAVRAFQTDPNPQTRAMLFRAVTASPKLVRYLPVGGEVTKVGASGDGRTAVAGLADGRVVRWRLGEDHPTTLFSLSGKVSGLSVSRNGAVVFGSDGAGAALWRAGHPSVRMPVPDGEKPDTVGLSPSGRTAVLHSGGPIAGGHASLSVLDVTGSTRPRVHSDPFPRQQGSYTIVVPSDDEAMFFDNWGGGLQRRRLSDWTATLQWNLEFGAHLRSYSGAASNDGRFVSATNGDSTVPVWPSTMRSDPFNRPYSATAGAGDPSAIALSPDGKTAAAANAGTIVVSRVARVGASRAPAVELDGNGIVNEDGLRFLGDGSHLLSASGDQLAVWDLNSSTVPRTPRRSLLSPRAAPAPLLGSRSPQTANGWRWLTAAAARPSFRSLADLSSPPVSARADNQSYSYGPPVWASAGLYVALPVSPPGGGSGVRAPTGLAPAFRAWPAGEGSDFVVTAASGPTRNTVALVTTHGAVRLHDVGSGALLRTIPGPPDLASDSDRLGLSGRQATLDPTGNLLAVIDRDRVAVTDLKSGRVVRAVRISDAATVAFSGDHLLVQRKDGGIEVRLAANLTLERVILPEAAYVGGLVANRQGSMLALQGSDGSVQLLDLTTGSPIGIVPALDSGSGLTGLAYTADGSRLVMVVGNPYGAPGATLVQRTVSDAGLVRIACQAAGRDLSAAEWRAMVGPDVPANLACLR